MHELLNILGQEGDGQELLWVIAIIIFTVLGSLGEWIKNKRARSETDKTIPRPPKPAAPARRSVSGVPHPSRPPVSRPQAPPRRTAPPHQRAPRAQPAQRATPPGPPRRPARTPLPQRDIPVQRPAQPPVIVTPQPRISQTPPTPPPKTIAQAPAVQPVRTSEMARQEVAAPRPNIARELIFKSGQRLSRADLRRAVILNELFSPPVSLRSDEHLWDR